MIKNSGLKYKLTMKVHLVPESYGVTGDLWGRKPSFKICQSGVTCLKHEQKELLKLVQNYTFDVYSLLVVHMLVTN